MPSLPLLSPQQDGIVLIKMYQRRKDAVEQASGLADESWEDNWVAEPF